MKQAKASNDYSTTRDACSMSMLEGVEANTKQISTQRAEGTRSEA
jgi:hypothetical protein